MYLMTAHIVAVQSPLVRWIAVHLDAEHSWPQPSFQGQRQGLANSVRCLVSWAMKWPPDIIVGTSVTRYTMHVLQVGCRLTPFSDKHELEKGGTQRTAPCSRRTLPRMSIGPQHCDENRLGNLWAWWCPIQISSRYHNAWAGDLPAQIHPSF